MVLFKLLTNQEMIFIQLVLTYIMTTNAISKLPNASLEHVLHQELRKYNPMVRPVLSPQHMINVTFSVKLLGVAGLDMKKQVVSCKLLIVQTWQNPFLTWDPSKFDGLGRIRMNYKYVWVPDISLQNNAANPALQEGSLPLYKKWVTVHSNGTNVWRSLEMIDSNCEIDIALFPFDDQTCFLNFSSESYDSSQLGIILSSRKVSDDYLETLSDGEWTINEFSVSLDEKTRDPWPGRYAQVDIILKMERRELFYILYYLLPCVVLALLMFVSFIIPPDTGERIGFCSSLLLALSVYLLLFSDLLPNTRGISLLGIVFAVVFLETAFALLATVLVLKAFHATSEVPKILRVLCCLGCLKKTSPNTIKPKQSNILKMGTKTMKNAIPLEESKSTQELYEASTVPVMDFKEQEPSEDQKHEDNKKRWAKVARRLDKLFFWLFMLGMVTSIMYIIIAKSAVTQLLE